LTIVAKDYYEKKLKALLVIMLNPGNSRPVDKTYKPVQLKNIAMDTSIDLIAATPDNTQYQIMRVMKELGYTLAAIINILDVRETDSRKLAKMSVNFEKEETSIFHKNRKKELKDNLCFKQDVIVAWSCKIGKEATDLLLDRIKINNNRIFSKINKEGLVWHANPRNKKLQCEWLNEIITDIKKSKLMDDLPRY